MATPEQLQAKLAEIRASNPSVPGISFETILDPLVEAKYSGPLAQCRTPEQRAALKEDIKNNLRNEGRALIEQQIDGLNSSYAALQKSIINLTLAASTLATTLATPTSVAAAPPIAAGILAMIDSATAPIVGLLSNAIALGIEIPDAALVPIDAILAIKKLIPNPSSISPPPPQQGG